MQPTPPWHIATKERKEKKRKNFRYGTASFTLSFFFLVGSSGGDGGDSGTRGENGEFSKGKSGRGMGKSEKECVAKTWKSEKKCVAK